jgi:peroxin-6
MDGSSFEPEHPKKRRRRHYGERPVAARLVLDDSLHGEVGVLSGDLWAKLTAGSTDKYGEITLILGASEANNIDIGTNCPSGSKQETTFVATAPSTPSTTTLQDIPWTILSVKKLDGGHSEDDEKAQATIRFPAKSSCSQSFLNHLEALDPCRNLSPTSVTVQIRIVRVKPLVLDTVYVTVEKNLLEDVDDAQKRFGGGFDDPQKTGTHHRDRRKANKISDASGAYWNISGSAQSRLARVVREAIAIPPIIRAGDEIALPLPSHPITHNRPPPAYVSACEPVTQGLVSPGTWIILVQAEPISGKIARRTLSKTTKLPVLEDDAEDTSNEQFYSAAEEKEDDDESWAEGYLEQDDTDHSSQQDSEYISDESLEDMISLRTPELPAQRFATFSGTRNATPRPGGKEHTGTHTPGSLYSSYSQATTRVGSRPGKVCRTEALLQRLPTAVLHPKPSDEDDDESFIFVDINTLTKIGCFSGDWVRLEKCNRPFANGITSLNSGNLGSSADDSYDWRAVRIFGLSNLASWRPRYALGDKDTNKTWLSSSSLTPVVYTPPILLHNLGAPNFVKLSALPKPRLSPPHASPKAPSAKEVRLRKVSTPISTKKEVQSSLFATLKHHFQLKFRILKTGDLIAVAFDEELGKATFEVGQSSENIGEDVTTPGLGVVVSGKYSKPNIAWFAVEHIIPEDVEKSNEQLDEAGGWGGILTVDPSRTRIAQEGGIVQSIPGSLAHNAAIWLGLKNSPRRSSIVTQGPGSDGYKVQPYILPLQKRLSALVSSATSPRALILGLPPLAILLHSTQRQVGKSYLASWACAAAGVHAFFISAHDVLADGGSANGGGDVKTEIGLKIRAERAFSCGSQFTALVVTHVEMLTADRMVPTLSEVISDSRVLIATTTELDKMPDGLRSLFTHEIDVHAPSETEREGILNNACLEQGLRLDPSVHLDVVALQTAALVAGDLVDVVDRASQAHARRVEQLTAAKDVSKGDIMYSGGSLASSVTNADFNEAIGRARSTFSDSIGAPKIPTVTWKDVGGLADQKSSIIETISLPLTRPELFAKGMRKRSGILFYGPPGTGKTLLAKAIATEFSLNFFSVKGPELLNMYIGESEANVRRVFQRARDARPCVVFFDELDSVAPKRGNQGDSGGVMDRIVSQLLAELDGMSSGGSSDKESEDGTNGNAGGVFVIGATNRPDLLDPALLRPGRFDKMLYLGVSSTHEQQATILEALTRKFALDANVNLARVASRLPFTYTGADLYALCSDAMLKAITKKTKQVDMRVQEASRARGEEISTAYYFDHLARPDDTTVIIGEDDFAAAQRELVASVR